MDKQVILSNAYDYFLTFFNKKSESYNKRKVTAFKFNPFTIQAAAKGIGDNVTPHSIALATVYPFALGTSLATSFGTKTQEFIVSTMGEDSVTPSVVKGMDIEYIDAFDHRKKYCQLKAGPTTINYDDVDTICNHFKSLMKLGVTNHLKISNEDCVTGVLYGKDEDLSTMYSKIKDEGYMVLAGEDFWEHLTGIKGIYNDLVLTARQASNDSSMKDSINQLVEKVEQYVNDNKELFGL